MATLTEVREGIATLLSTIPGLQSSARLLTNPSPPTAYVLPGETNFHQTFGDGPSDYNLIIELQMLGSDIGAQMKLDDFLAETGEVSIKAAIETDPTLGGLVDDLIVQGFRDYGLFQTRSQVDPVLGARVLVWVLN